MIFITITCFTDHDHSLNRIQFSQVIIPRFITVVTYFWYPVILLSNPSQLEHIVRKLKMVFGFIFRRQEEWLWSHFALHRAQAWIDGWGPASQGYGLRFNADEKLFTLWHYHCRGIKEIYEKLYIFKQVWPFQRLSSLSFAHRQHTRWGQTVQQNKNSK